MRNLLNFLLKYNHWFLFILLEVISFVLLFRFNNYQGSVFFTSSNALVGGVYELAGQVTGYFHLKETNEDLVQENVSLRLQTEALREALREYTNDTTAIERIRQEALQEYDMCKAKVINNSLIYSDNYLTINKGREDGVREDMGVVGGNGLVGIVYQASDHYSVVIPVLNSKSNISCKVKRSEYFGFLSWDGISSEYAIVRDMPRHSVISLGDTIVTSGHSAVFPTGVPVGIVEDISDSNDGLSYRVKVKLFTDYARLKDVCVIEKKGRYEQEELENRAKE
jgi:rod shape-determining protein MreC